MATELDRRKLVEQACVDWEDDLRLFLKGILRDRHLVEDALQRTVMNAIRSAEAVQQLTLRGWMFRIALNEARQLLRAARRSEVLLSDVVTVNEGWHIATGLPVESGLLAEELKLAVRRSLMNLPEDYRTVVRGRIFEGKTFAEIAAEMRVPLGTVLTWMRRALLKLRDDSDLKNYQDFSDTDGARLAASDD